MPLSRVVAIESSPSSRLLEIPVSCMFVHRVVAVESLQSSRRVIAVIIEIPYVPACYSIESSKSNRRSRVVESSQSVLNFPLFLHVGRVATPDSQSNRRFNKMGSGVAGRSAAVRIPPDRFQSPPVHGGKTLRICSRWCPWTPPWYPSCSAPRRRRPYPASPRYCPHFYV